MKRSKVLNFPISIGKFPQFVESIVEAAVEGSGKYVFVANVHMFMEAFWSATFLEMANDAYIITPDGKPLTWALRLLYGIKQPRVSGMDLLPELLLKAEHLDIPVCFYGGSPELLLKTDAFVKQNYPGLKNAGLFSPPFREPNEQELAHAEDQIRNSGAKLIFVVLGCPKQERWMASMKGRFNAVMIGIGGALPVLVGMKKRAPAWMQHAGLEWFYRFIQEPERLFKRYLITNSAFIYLLLKVFIKTRILKSRLNSQKE